MKKQQKQILLKRRNNFMRKQEVFSLTAKELYQYYHLL